MKKAFVNSLPKSGTNLVGKCLELFEYQQLHGFASSEVLSNTFKAKIKRLLWMPWKQGYLIGIDTPVEISRSAINKRLDAVGPDQFLFGHVGYTSDFLAKVREKEFVLFVMLRDPRAVLNSFVHYVVSNKRHVMHEEFLKMTVDQRYRAALYGCHGVDASLESLKIRCSSLNPWIESSDVTLLQYEQLVGDKGGGCQEAQRRSLVVLCKALEIPVNGIEGVIDELHGPGRVTFRKGQIDSWREEIPLSLQAEINQELAGILQAWNYAV
ncbi:sulfotransferase domain-containing protein [Oceanicoccus sp. KOV_DT_Chl]|uniref:sulfotransferase domain-containing protein n=1 Tax=Oceanicoccus sp. KOV_DT_Chl TaxID=1904639 RepID=UPI0011AF3706|nr:sulfotransferase domain-containing protein [Oceanicoccus sp. KOV_DT_Chl]